MKKEEKKPLSPLQVARVEIKKLKAENERLRIQLKRDDNDWIKISDEYYRNQKLVERYRKLYGELDEEVD